jgi:hypothetical protein
MIFDNMFRTCISNTNFGMNFYHSRNCLPITVHLTLASSRVPVENAMIPLRLTARWDQNATTYYILPKTARLKGPLGTDAGYTSSFTFCASFVKQFLFFSIPTVTTRYKKLHESVGGCNVLHLSSTSSYLFRNVSVSPLCFSELCYRTYNRPIYGLL